MPRFEYRPHIGLALVKDSLAFYGRKCGESEQKVGTQAKPAEDEGFPATVQVYQTEL
jgi:hypothetical protein